MSERLTEEQVAEALTLARKWQHAGEGHPTQVLSCALLQLHADLEEAKSSAMYANQHVEADKAFRTRVMDALGNGADEALWPPGVHWSDAASRAIRALSTLREAAREAVKALEYLVVSPPHPEFRDQGIEPILKHWSHTGPKRDYLRCPRCLVEPALTKLRSLLEVKA